MQAFIDNVSTRYPIVFAIIVNLIWWCPIMFYCWYTEQKRRNAAALTIQSAFRTYCARKRQRIAAAIVIQKAWRMHVAKRNMLSLRKLMLIHMLYERIWEHYATKMWSLACFYADMDRVLALADCINTYRNMEIRSIRSAFVYKLMSECGYTPRYTSEQAVNIIKRAWRVYVIRRNLRSLSIIGRINRSGHANEEAITKSLEMLDAVQIYNDHMRSMRKNVVYKLLKKQV